MIRKTVSLFAAFCLSCVAAFAGVNDIVRFDRTVYDWGDVTIKDGPLRCVFTFTNVGDAPVSVTSVRSSCGCTSVKWTLEPVGPGQSGTVEAVYTNDEGPYPFDKTLSVSFDRVRRPVVLHLRGVVHKRKLPLAETYPIHLDGFALRDTVFKIGNLSQGESKSAEIRVANVGKTSVNVSWADVSPNLSFTPAVIEIKAGETVVLGVTVDADRTLWGTNTYTAIPVVNGRRQSHGIAFSATTKENFDLWSEARIKSAPVAQVPETSCAPEPVSKGTPMKARFEISNAGRTPLHIYAVDLSSDALSVAADFPLEVAVGEKRVLDFTIDTASLKAGKERLFIATLYTDDPQRSLIHLYIDAIIL